jgi:cytosine/adenosine deaminase-related metal-dependent hydrolase
VTGAGESGYVNAHTHTFQRGLRSEAGDFWAWREAMLKLAAEQTPERVQHEYEATYREMHDAGYRVVGEFHYLGLGEGRSAAVGADAARIQLVILLSAYARGGIERSRQASPEEYFSQVEQLRAVGIRVGVAPHSVRACPTTEADLGDGFPPSRAIRERGIGICIGSDANVSVDPHDELRELEWIARRQELRRGVFSPEELQRIGAGEGAASLGL